MKGGRMFTPLSGGGADVPLGRRKRSWSLFSSTGKRGSVTTYDDDVDGITTTTTTATTTTTIMLTMMIMAMTIEGVAANEERI